MTESIPEMGVRQKKKTYVKPELAQVRLRPEEAVLGGCKLAGGYGPVVNSCRSGPTPCTNIGTT